MTSGEDTTKTDLYLQVCGAGEQLDAHALYGHTEFSGKPCNQLALFCRKGNQCKVEDCFCHKRTELLGIILLITHKMIISMACYLYLQSGLIKLMH